MKKIISMLLLAAMLVSALAGCGSTLDEENNEKGYTINVYLSNEISDFDPALAYTDDAMVKVLGLVFEGLTRIGTDGKLENAMLKSYKIIEDEERNDYRIQLTIKETKWSDGRVVAADDYVYAWKRILDPEFTSSAASLLFDVKNARDVKNGDNSIDDVGIAAVDDDVIEVQFEGKIDYQLFLENLACPAFVPLREDVVTRYDAFGTAVSTFCSNGPFAIKGLELGKRLMLERNVYYFRNTDKDNPDPLDKYVIPYRMEINFEADVDANTADYEAGKLMYISEIALAKRAGYVETATVTDMLSTFSFVCNTSKSALKNAETRQALSKLLDRNKVAELVTFATPATGLIPPKVYDKAIGDSFRTNGGDILSASAQSASGSGSFSLTVRDEQVEMAIAEYAKGVWEAAGFKVTVKALDAASFKEAYETGNYDVIGIDFTSLTTDAFGVLAPFSPAFSGNGIDIQNDNYDHVPYIPGYDNPAYTELIEKAFAEKDRTARSATLHDAEKLLLEDMPIIPVIFNQDAYVYNTEALSGIKDTYAGYRILNKMKLKDWRSYLVTETTAAEGDEPTAAQ